MRSRLLTLVLITSLCAISIPAQGDVVAPNSKMKLIKTINGSISPKSVRSSGDGVVSAHNMMYRHSITVYDAKTFELLKKNLSDSSFKLYQTALGEKNESLSIEVNTSTQSDSKSLRNVALPATSIQSEVIEVVTLDEFVARNGLSEIDFLKIDVMKRWAGKLKFAGLIDAFLGVFDNAKGDICGLHTP